MRSIRALLAAITVLALGVFPLLSPLPVQAALGNITISPSSGPPGTAIIVTGSGFTSPSTYTIFIDGVSTGATGAVPVGGVISNSFNIGPSPRGGHAITVTTTAPDTSNSVTFTITPLITTSITTGQVGDQININGLGFSPSVPVTIFWDSQSMIIVNTDSGGTFNGAAITIPPAYQGTHNVYANDSIGSTFNVGFVVIPKMIISPTTVQAGSQVTASGTGFAANSSITILVDDATATSSAVTTDTNGSFSGAVFTVPVLSQGNHVVKARDGSGNLAVYGLTMVQSVGLSPASGAPGTSIQITGSGFGPAKYVTVTYGGASLTTNPAQVLTDGQGSFKAFFAVPGGSAGSYTIIAADDVNTATATFKVVAGGIITPTSGPAGTAISIQGIGFNTNGTVTVAYDGIQVGSGKADSQGAFSFTINAPVSQGGNHQVTANDNLNTIIMNFSITPTASTSPASGYVGTGITITGTGFAAGKTVTLSYDSNLVGTATADAKGSLSAAIQAPASATGNHEVTATDGVNRVANSFAILPSATLNPGSGSVSSNITLNGAGFTSGATIVMKYDDSQLATFAADPRGSFTALLKAPASRAGNHTISVGDSANTIKMSFNILPAANISPASGNVGTGITVVGTGFAPSASIALKYDNTQGAATNSDASGSFGAALVAPASKGGTHLITVSDGTNTMTFNFAMDSTPPAAPVLQTPADLTQADQLASFTWSAVSDPSGVTYSLQIAADVTFSQILVDKSGLAGPGYTLSDTEKLKSVSKENPYYWRVKAIDRASNESAWTKPQSFYVGFALSSWGLYGIFGGAVVLVGLAGFWLGRKTSFF